MDTTRFQNWMQSEWIQKKTYDFKPIGEENSGVFSFFDKETRVRKALQVIEYEKVRSEMR